MAGSVSSAPPLPASAQVATKARPSADVPTARRPNSGPPMTAESIEARAKAAFVARDDARIARDQAQTRAALFAVGQRNVDFFA
ncbi:MAG: hypothetical protein J0H39_16180 [Alphaproteobacteria bacterium]|nr:hypothetical protein [Alphaproteobacteria bacterium]MBN9498294.1 hypothetical protein [Alphaproteobacteria bacterium]